LTGTPIDLDNLSDEEKKALLNKLEAQANADGLSPEERAELEAQLANAKTPEERLAILAKLTGKPVDLDNMTDEEKLALLAELEAQNNDREMSPEDIAALEAQLANAKTPEERAAILEKLRAAKSGAGLNGPAAVLLGEVQCNLSSEGMSPDSQRGLQELRSAPNKPELLRSARGKATINLDDVSEDQKEALLTLFNVKVTGPGGLTPEEQEELQKQLENATGDERLALLAKLAGENIDLENLTDAEKQALLAKLEADTMSPEERAALEDQLANAKTDDEKLAILAKLLGKDIDLDNLSDEEKKALLAKLEDEAREQRVNDMSP